MKGVHWIDLGPWPVALAVIADKKAYGRFVRERCDKRSPPPSYPSFNAGVCVKMKHPDGTALMLIGIGPQCDASEMASTLAHEATHAMRWILEYVGEEEPGTETEAYLVGHIVKRGLEALTN